MQDNKRVLDFINRSAWTFAKTMPQWPHYYIVRENCNDEDFVELVKYIRENGHPENYYKRVLIYCQIGDWVYWTMGDPIEETTIINRCKPEDTYEYKVKNGIKF